MSLTPLQERILDAHRRGATRELAELQAEYRRRAVLTSSGRPGAVVDRVSVVEPRRPAARPSRERTSSSQVEVLLTGRARDQIFHRAMWETGMDGRETGGGLFGINAWDRVLVVHANGPGSRAKREPDRVEFDTSSFEHWDIFDADVARIGCWHTHPGTSNGKPSDMGRDGGDIPAWRAGLQRINREKWQPTYVGLILTGERTWGRPTVHAWTLDHDGQLERAAVTELRED